MSTAVLLVDDDENDSYLLQRALFRLGVENVNSLKFDDDAAKYLAGLPPFEFRQMPDVVFLDFHLHGTGLDACGLIRWIKSTPDLKKIRIIVLSGFTAFSEQEKMIKLGAEAYYVKPHSASGLTDMCRLVLHRAFASAA